MINITFEETNIDAIICLNSQFNVDPIYYFIKNKITIIAADGAGTYLLSQKIEPDFIVGDLDSFFARPDISDLFPKERLVFVQEQETNDFEKCLKFAIEKEYKNILILGIHGGIFEHSLNNWSVLSKYSKILNLVALDKYRYGFCMNKSFKLETYYNEIVSLIPLGSAQITTENLQWKLDNEKLMLGEREGARNVALGEFIKVELHSGELFIFLDSRFPKFLKFN
jgi:thiamine pyrophosphokinase